MGWTGKQMVLALVMVFTGSINTLTAKWADRIQSVNRQGHKTTFSHPFFQADCMFIGEMLCLATFYLQLMITRRSQRDTVEMAPDPHQVVDVPRYIFYLPAICDVTATSMMYLGLTLTYSSSFQMLRGAVIVFTGLLSVAFLGRRLRYFHWLGIVIVIGGLIIVGFSDFLVSGEDKYDINGIITGDLLIVAAQVFTATQMVVEEKFLAKYKAPPLMVVGWEGVFGFLTLSVLLVPMYYIPAGKFSGNERGVLEDAIDAFVQLSNSGTLVASIILTIISIAFFNFAGVSVTKEFSATTRMVLDSVRTLVIWLVTLALRWQTFQYLQPIGYVVLVVGMMLYNDVLILPFLRRRGLVRDQPSESDSQPVIKSTDEVDGVDNGATVEPF
ncbi:solute carrier family 35 member F6-like [Homarus americanus]|uniref:solute carrier family 35 member F6-like n=1 Tax=Homarus americanus TaxID=6706 RepID=UPI001C48A6F2|nr:solute carrier family 35 member F6-like [Homarus americanus]XP_042232755.1 solute carrier family 35 member F6-like [Homarus americanus]